MSRAWWTAVGAGRGNEMRRGLVEWQRDILMLPQTPTNPDGGMREGGTGGAPPILPEPDAGVPEASPVPPGASTSVGASELERVGLCDRGAERRGDHGEVFSRDVAGRVRSRCVLACGECQALSSRCALRGIVITRSRLPLWYAEFISDFEWAIQDLNLKPTD